MTAGVFWSVGLADFWVGWASVGPAGTGVGDVAVEGCNCGTLAGGAVTPEEGTNTVSRRSGRSSVSSASSFTRRPIAVRWLEHLDMPQRTTQPKKTKMISVSILGSFMCGK